MNAPLTAAAPLTRTFPEGYASIRPFDLNLRHLRALLMIADFRSISAAAKTMNLSQPALTQGIARLEKAVGVSLFDRRPSGMYPTAAGWAFTGRVRDAMGHLTAAVEEIGCAARRGFSSPELMMTGSQLRALVSLFDTSSLADASEATGLLPRTLRRAVHQLENACGVPLVEQRLQGAALTDAGKVLARAARFVAAEIEAGLLECMDDVAAGGRITIGAVPLAQVDVLSDAIVSFLDVSPASRVDVQEGSWSELVRSLRDGMIDFMLGALQNPEPADLRQIPLARTNIAVFGRRGHPLSAIDQPTNEDFKRFPWVMTENTPFKKSVLMGDPRMPRVPVECGSLPLIRRMLCTSDFLAVLSPTQVSMELERGMLVRINAPLPANLPSLGICTRRDWRPSPAQRQFLQILEETVCDDNDPIRRFGMDLAPTEM